MAALLAIRIILDIYRLSADPRRYWNQEEAYNAAVGFYAWHAGLWDQLLRLQSKTFCGGCSVVSLLSVPALAIGGDEFWAFKALALLWTAAVGATGFMALRSLSGPGSAWIFLVLFAFPATGWQDSSLMLWGNHAESALIVLAALWAFGRGRGIALGLILGVGLWFCRTTAYAALVIGAATALSGGRRFGWTILGVIIGASLVLLPAAGGDSGGYDMAGGELFSAAGVARVGSRLALLVEPKRFAARAWPTDVWMVPFGAAFLAGTGLSLALFAVRKEIPHRWVFSSLIAAYALFFAVANLANARVGPNAPILNFRYHGPWFFVLMLGVAAAVGPSLTRATPRWARGMAWLALALAFVPNIIGQIHLLGIQSAVWPGSIPLLDHPGFAGAASGRIDPARVQAAHSENPVVEATLRRMEGYQAASAAARLPNGDKLAAAKEILQSDASAAWEGLGQGLAAQGPGCVFPASIELEPDQLSALRRGLAYQLGVGADPEVRAFLLGVSCRKPGESRTRCEALSASFDTSFVAGLSDPMAGAAGPLPAFGQAPGNAKVRRKKP